jgi:hypothetical protein
MWPSQRSAGVIVIAIACLGMTASISVGQEPAKAQKVEIPETATTLEGIPTVRIDSAQAGGNRHRNCLIPEKEDGGGGGSRT